MSVATKLCKKYGVNPKIQLVNTLGNQQEDYAHFDFDSKVMKISKKATKDLKEFVISVLHEIDHAKDAQKFGKKKYKDRYEMEMNKAVAKGGDAHDDNYFEKKAEKFGRKMAKDFLKINRKNIYK